MQALTTFVAIGWIAFWLYWLIAATRAKSGAHRRRVPIALRIFIGAFVVLRLFRAGSVAIHDPAVRVLGAVAFGSGLALAVWARIYLGRNWGMPMSEKDEPELVTSGPYRYVRHPIYTGILLAMLGTALAVDLYWLVAFALTAPYFVYSARIEERLMTSSFPSAYPRYRAATKMLIPFVF